MDRQSGDRAGVASRRPVRSGASPFVGRGEELRRLAAALDLAAEGQGGTIFLTGQPGIGKTRLAREALALARERGFTVLEGRAYPLEVGLAYAPLLDAFSPLLRGLDPNRLAALMDGLPDLGRLFSSIRLPQPAVPVEGLGDPALEKTRLFEAVSRLLERLVQEAPVALFVDDVHWADPASLELLHYLARGLSHQRGLLLATYSADNPESARRLRALVVSLGRAGLAEEIMVPRLEPPAVDQLVQGILGAPAPGRLLSLVDARAGGTPLFVEALIHTLVDSGHLVRQGRSWDMDVEGETTIPPSVRQLILARLDRLAPVDRGVLGLIAITGDAAPHTMLRVAGDLAEETLVATLRRLRDAGLVSEKLDDQEVTYSITHPLIQQVAHDELPQMARRRAHLSAIQALESLSELRPSDLSRLARHYHGAGIEADPGRALTVLLAAGERARSLYANEEAARFFSAALSIIRDAKGRGYGAEGLGDPLHNPIPSTLYPQPSTLPDVLERLGEVWERIGESSAAIGVWNEALAERGRMGDALAASRLHAQLAFAEWDRGNFDVANAHLEAGLAALAGHEPCQELADLYFTRFYIVSRLRDVEGQAATAAALLSLAEQLASPRVEAEANLAASMFSLGQSDVSTARERAEHALRLAESSSEGPELAISCRAHSALVLVGIRLGDHQFIRRHAERGLAVAERLGAPYTQILLQLRLAYAHFLSGAWDQSLRYNLEATALARRVGHPRNLASCLAERAVLVALQGDLAEAEACIAEVRLAFGSLSGVGQADRAVFGNIDIAETAVALERGEVERALGIARGFASPSMSGSPPTGLTVSYVPVGLMLLGEAQVTAGEAAGALETAHKILGLGPPGAPYLAALAARAEGLASQALGRPEAAMNCLDRAHQGFTALDMPFEAAKCLLEWAAVALAGEPHAAAIAAQASLAIFERLGARRHVDRSRHLFRQLGVSPLASRRSRPDGCPLSGREIEVARLGAEGLTTAEIAERLTLSPLTVTTHLRHIYSRLHIHSRAALARYMVESGLLPPKVDNT